MITKEKVLKALATVKDPDLNKDLVSLGMISDLSVEGGNISFKVTLTTPACPMKEKIRQDCMEAITNEFGEGVKVNLSMDATVTTLREKQNLLPGVKNIIAVASGKGGV